MLRGETRRGAELADLSGRLLPKAEGATDCHLLMLQVSNGKTNKFGKRRYGGVIRNRDPLLCTMSALAIYFFFRWHQSKEPPPDFQRRKNWYSTKVLVGSDPVKPLAFRQQYDDITEIFEQEGVVADSKTHAPRKAGPQSAEFHGVPDSQVCFNSTLVTSITSWLTGLDYADQSPGALGPFSPL